MYSLDNYRKRVGIMSTCRKSYKQLESDLSNLAHEIAEKKKQLKEAKKQEIDKLEKRIGKIFVDKYSAEELLRKSDEELEAFIDFIMSELDTCNLYDDSLDGFDFSEIAYLYDNN